LVQALVSGSPDRSGPQAGRFSWSLTGPNGSPVGNHGTSDTLEEAEAQLMAALGNGGSRRGERRGLTSFGVLLDLAGRLRARLGNSSELRMGGIGALQT
jgi:hypothetical protein